jgi:hypothetical protein
MAKSIAKKSTAKKSANGQKARKPNAIHEALVKLMTRPNGATITDIQEAKFKAAAMQALKIVGRRGYKTNVVKKAGELTRYVAKRA